MTLKKSFWLLILVTFLVFTSFTSAKLFAATSYSDIEGRQIDYQIEGKPFSGYLALPKGSNKVPSVLVVHEWWGHNEYARYRARELAKLGYAAFALDVYGDGKTAYDPKHAEHLMLGAIDSGKIQQRFETALQVLQSEPRVDKDKIAAIGYCFGGSVVLTMALLDEPLKAVVSFHGAFALIPAIQPTRVKTNVLILHGSEDKFAPIDLVKKFETKLKAVHAAYQVVIYPGAKHGFTDPDANRIAEMHGAPVGYNPDADAKSWLAMQKLFTATLR
jgi:dienelactone hydrolase